MRDSERCICGNDEDQQSRVAVLKCPVHGRVTGPCLGCGAPEGFPPAGPCDNHGTAFAHAR